MEDQSSIQASPKLILQPNPSDTPPVVPETKSKKGLVINLLLLLLITSGAASYFGYQNYQLRQENLQLQPDGSPIVFPSPSPSPSFIPTENWILYKNEKFGFSIEYPVSLNVKPTEVDIKADAREYQEKCESGVYDGCGGSRWPDFKISFIRPNGNSAFDVSIHQLPVRKNLGGIEKDRFTYKVTTFHNFGENIEVEPVDDKTLEEIASTLSFFQPKQPLACLWSLEFAPSFDPEEDKDYIEENASKLVRLSGVYFDASQGSCMTTVFYTWKGQEESDKPPFEKLEDCFSACGKRL